MPKNWVAQMVKIISDASIFLQRTYNYVNGTRNKTMIQQMEDGIMMMPDFTSIAEP
jgi:hypothetical protein